MPSPVKSRPITFSAAMVRALLENRKSQTRRIMQVQPPAEGYEIATLVATTGPRKNIGRQHWTKRDGLMVVDGKQPYFSCPFGKPGDELYVKEAFQLHCGYDKTPVSAIVPPVAIQYPATYDGWVSKKRPANQMPEWASRLTLVVTEVRVQRLQDISEEDAIAEGVEGGCLNCGETPHSHDCAGALPSYRDGFAWLWESLHGPGSWERNEFVWAVSFSVRGAK